MLPIASDSVTHILVGTLEIPSLTTPDHISQEWNYCVTSFSQAGLFQQSFICLMLINKLDQIDTNLLMTLKTIHFERYI